MKLSDQKENGKRYVVNTRDGELQYVYKMNGCSLNLRVLVGDRVVTLSLTTDETERIKKFLADDIFTSVFLRQNAPKNLV